LVVFHIFILTEKTKKMNKNLNLKERIKKNWLSIILAFAFLITLLNYFELKTENSRLKRRSNNFENNIEMINQKNSNLEYEKEDLEKENEDLKSENEDY
jgi:F0F1-type ATP synthase membrane subunit b/b'